LRKTCRVYWRFVNGARFRALARPARGIGLMFILSGILMLLATAAAYAYPRLRLVEDELPDTVPVAGG
jgi:hypothetical protein